MLTQLADTVKRERVSDNCLCVCPNKPVDSLIEIRYNAKYYRPTQKAGISMFDQEPLDKTVPIPLHYQLKTLILDQIKSGKYPSGSQIPTEIEISKYYDISRSTVQKAINDLVSEGYLYRVRSKGTFVSRPKAEQNLLSALYRYHDEAAHTGTADRNEVLELKVVDMPDTLIELKAGKKGDKSIYLCRRRMADDIIMERSITYFPYERFQFLLEEGTDFSSLQDLLDSNPDTKICRLVRFIEAVPASSDDIRIMDVAEGSAIQKVTTIHYDELDRLLDVSYAYFRGDKKRIHLEARLSN